MVIHTFLIKHKILFQLILIFISTLISLFTENLAVLGFTVLFFMMGLFLINRLNGRSKDDVSLFSFIFLIYYLYAFVTDYVYIVDFRTDFFYALDSTKFFGLAYDLNNAKAGLDSYLFEYRFSFGYGYLVYFFNLFSNILGGYPTSFLHKIHIVFLNSSVIVYTYILAKRLLREIDVVILFNYIFIFALLSHFFVFSAILIRDIHIVFLYLLAFIILTKKNSIFNLIVLILICFLIFQFRIVNGIFSLIFILTFFYKFILRKKNKTQKKILTVLILLIGIAVVFSSSSLIDLGEIERKAEGYSDYHDQVLKEGSGFAKTVYNLPVIVRPFAFIFLSQITPLPATQAIFVNTIRDNQLLLFPLIFSTIFWIYIDIIILLNFYKRKFLKQTNSLLGVFVIISLVFLFATSSSSPEFRRLLPVYPIMYIYFIFIYNKLSSSYKKKVLTVYFLIYVLISIFIFYLKL
ncbi:hypothetical protein [Myroides guanonis]|uniref:Dolichyl-phosphate-mannose-protein mannosyltransferase n=1 Tax=Myroides guanonis TaxID=1150112 RepID=A0A1I3L4M7_9FLAO|nr:hypothetical protein [Myroides guanonis]SFI79405.1 hypothetical protein SAMN04487893_101166 [Myroides guanonis]